eukprot:15984-Heterococcus_DN1.PRE.2
MLHERTGVSVTLKVLPVIQAVAAVAKTVLELALVIAYSIDNSSISAGQGSKKFTSAAAACALTRGHSTAAAAAASADATQGTSIASSIISVVVAHAEHMQLALPGSSKVTNLRSLHCYKSALCTDATTCTFAQAIATAVSSVTRCSHCLQQRRHYSTMVLLLYTHTNMPK